MNRAEFQSSENLMSQLADILDNNVVKIALEIVKDEGPSDSLPTPVPGVDYSAHMAAIGAASIGWARSIRALHSLARKPTLLSNMQNNQEASYLKHAIKRVMGSGQYTQEEIEATLKQN